MADSSLFFYGSSANRLNSKGQVSIPKRFRSVVGEDEIARGFVLIIGEHECIYMYTHMQFEAVKERVRKIARQENNQEFFRAFLEDAHAIDLDSQGRFVLPASLRQAAGINGPDVLFIGLDDRIEIWAPEKRDQQRTKAADYQEKRKREARKIFGI